jgi:hypothetical protein
VRGTGLRGIIAPFGGVRPLRFAEARDANNYDTRLRDIGRMNVLE